MEDKRMTAYLANVSQAAECLETARNMETDIRAHHVQVMLAHKKLKSACRTYRWRTVGRWLIFFGEEHAVAMGYMRFDEVEKP